MLLLNSASAVRSSCRHRVSTAEICVCVTAELFITPSWLPPQSSPCHRWVPPARCAAGGPCRVSKPDSAPANLPAAVHVYSETSKASLSVHRHSAKDELPSSLPLIVTPLLALLTRSLWAAELFPEGQRRQYDQKARGVC